MNSIKDIRIITKEEGQVLYRAIFPYFSELLKEKGAKDPEVLLAHQIYQDLRRWEFEDSNED
jgi:hypothetical protein